MNRGAQTLPALARDIQMARELGFNPRKLGKIANHDQESWKVPPPDFIEDLYFKRFGRERPDVVVSIEDRARRAEKKKAGGKAAWRTRCEQPTMEPSNE
ncbi:MAG: hypothetical protein H0W55_14560 [Actinobacteria bacterium]|nr:hypothetical protein [Actinomycetota bacterium]